MLCKRVFSDPAAWDMLEKLGGSNNAEELKESMLARQSLYVKFDPLVKGPGLAIASTNLTAAANAEFAGHDTIARAPEVEKIVENDDLMLMSTPPAKQPSARHPAARALQQKVAEQQQAVAGDNYDVDKFLACSPQSSTNEADSGRPSSASPPPHMYAEGMLGGDNPLEIVQVLKYSQADVNRLRKESQLDYQARILAKEQEWAKRFQEQENRSQKQLADKEGLHGQIEKLNTSHEQMKTVVMEYEKTVNMLVAEKEQSSDENKDSLAELIRERDQGLEDLQSVEAAFSDLHRRYEKSKSTVESFKKNEETLKKCVADYQTKMKKHEEKYHSLKMHAEERLQSAHEAMETYKKATKGEIARLELALRKSDLEVKGLQQTVDQKTTENAELTAICDELLSKVN